MPVTGPKKEQMTSEEIDKLEAGPETDALMAVEVMGWPVHDMPSAFGHVFPNEQHWFYEGDHYWREDSKLLSVQFNPSTAISAVWEVVEKLGIRWIIDCVPKTGSYSARCEPDEGEMVRAIAPTAPLAICRAALKATLKGDLDGRQRQKALQDRQGRA